MAGTIPATVKPMPSAPASAAVMRSMMPLSTNTKSPSVRRTMGQVRAYRTGRTTAFTTPKTSATPRKGSQSPR
jgi:hypothetical protein